jgi:ATP-dependent Lhr-like helicase
MGQRIPISTHLAGRVQGLLHDAARWGGFPDDVREWLEVQRYRSRLPRPGELLVESFPHQGRHYSVFYTFEGWPANQSIGMLLTRRMAELGLSPLGFVANDYALAVWGCSRSKIQPRCSRRKS